MLRYYRSAASFYPYWEKVLPVCRVLAVVLGILCLAATGQSRDFQDFYHKRWTVREGAPRNIRSIAPGRDGFLWVATDHGLFRFDGIGFEAYRPDQDSGKELSQEISLVKALPSGIWIGYEGGGVSVLSDGRLTTYPPQDGLALGAVRSMSQTAGSSVWAATDFGLSRFDGRRWHEEGSPSQYPSTYTNNVFIDSRGTVWANTIDGLVYLPPNEVSFRSTGERYFTDTDFTEAPTGEIWFASRTNGVRKITTPTGKYISGGAFLNYESSGILIDHSGALWITTVGKGLFRTDAPNQTSTYTARPSQFKQLLEQNGLTANFPIQAVEDREGSIWIVSTKGLDQFHKSRFTPISLVPGSEYIALTIERNGELLIGSQQLLRTKSGIASAVPGGPQNVVCIYTDPDGVTWLSNRDGLWRTSGSKIVSQALPRAIKETQRSVQAMTLDRSHNLWVSFVGLGVYCLTGNAWARPLVLDSLPSGPPRVELTSLDGRLWFGYDNNQVASISEGTANVFDAAEGVDVANVNALAEVNGQLWIGGKSGLEYLSSGRFVRVTLAGSKKVEGISGIVQGQEGDIWLNTLDGVLRIPGQEIKLVLADARHQVHSDHFNYLDGIPGTPEQLRPLPSALRRSDGRLYFATRGSVVWIDPQDSQKNAVSPSVAIQSVTAGDEAFLNPADIAFAGQAKNLVIKYTASSLVVPERVRFRYKLEGLEKTWQEVTTLRQISYPRLSPGRYTFRVIASNDDGVWNEAGASVRLYIPPTFVQRTIFKVLCAAGVLGILWLLYWIRMQQVANGVRTLLLERVAERENIARDLHDTFLQGIQGLILSFHTATALVPPDQPSRKMLEGALRQSDDVMREGRSLLTQLRGRASQYDELSCALSSAANELGKGQTATFRLLVTGVPREIQPLVRDELYQVGREAISNAFRHADATNLELELVYGHRDFCLAIRDDGRGIDPSVIVAGRIDHWGLPGMKERSKKIGAALDIRSGPLSGTKVEIRIPGRLAYRDPSRTGSSSLARTFRKLLGVNHG